MLPPANWPVKMTIDPVFRPFTKNFLLGLKPWRRCGVCIGVHNFYTSLAEGFPEPVASKLKIEKS